MVTASRALTGRRVVSVSKDGIDRSLRFDFGDGRGLVLELASHRANLILLATGGLVEAAFRVHKSSSERLAAGTPWSARGLPPGRLDPLSAPSDQIDAAITMLVRAGESPLEAIRGAAYGLGPSSAELVLREAVRADRSPGTVLRERLDELLRGDGELVIEGPQEPTRAAESGAFDPKQFHLLPWRPFPQDAATTYSAGSSVATAGLFHDAVEGARRTEARLGALRSMLRGELRRVREAEEKVKEELRSFASPERYSRQGEALLAGLAAARRSENVVFVPDPYDPEARDIAIPSSPGKPLAEVADDLFRRGRRARRGLEVAGQRAQRLGERSRRLEALIAMGDRLAGPDAAGSLEEAMRSEGLAVGLARPTRAGKAASAHGPPRLEGIRMMTSADGWTILVGRTGRDNDRLSFKIAGSDDFWLHAKGVPGAHVVIRNPERRTTAPEGTLSEAARIAAWFSDARNEALVEVQWTRRKNVRRSKGGAPGRVILKRFQSLRVRPSPPSDAD